MMRWLPLLALLAGPCAAPARAAGRAHWRIATPQGAIHVLRPAGYRRETAGIVLYVHGFNTTVDRAWKRDRLEQQLTASQRNALFVAVAAPTSLEDGVRFPGLGAVLERVAQHTGLRLPSGNVVALGHSGGYWTIASWLDEKALDRVILLDGVYSFVREYRAWIQGDAHRRLVLVARGTRRLSRRLVRGLQGVVRRGRVPTTPDGFSKRERAARIVYMDSQHSHDALVKSGTVIPVVLQLGGLSRLRRAEGPNMR